MDSLPQSAPLKIDQLIAKFGLDAGDVEPYGWYKGKLALGLEQKLAGRPKGKYVVLSLVTTKRGTLEHKDELKRRIEAASKYVPREQLCLSPQCGFSSTVEGNSLTYDEEVAKLRLIVETAAEVWG